MCGCVDVSVIDITAGAGVVWRGVTAIIFLFGQALRVWGSALSSAFKNAHTAAA